MDTVRPRRSRLGINRCLDDRRGIPRSPADADSRLNPPRGGVRGAIAEDPDQRERSRYFELFLTPGEAERELLDAGGLRRLYDGLPADRIDRYVERFSQPGALTAALHWYRAMRRPGKRGPITTPTLYVWSTGDAFIGEVAARGVERHVDGPYRFEILVS
jgi:pimeloyl-ACP methyl ester carboxylesterase